jgi:O-antigen/teichoic acid export membrane protein
LISDGDDEFEYLVIIGMKRLWTEPRLLALLDQGVVSAGNFFTLLFIARRLAAEDFGLFSLAMMATLFLANLHRALFTQPLNILGAAEELPQLGGRVLALLRAHLLAIPVAVAMLIILSIRFFPQKALLFGCAAYVACFFLQEMLRRYWYTKGRFDRALANDAVSYGGQLLVLILTDMVWPIDGPRAFVVMALTSMAAFLLGLRKMQMPRDVVRCSVTGVLVQHWKLSKWLMLTVLAVWGASQIYPFLISPLGPIAVASFAACRNLLNAMGVIVQSVGNYLPTRAAVLLRQQGKSTFRRHLIQTVGRSALLGSLFLLAMLLFAETLMHLFYNGMYDVAAPLLRILAIGTFFSLMGAVLGAYSLAMEDSRSSFLANLGATAFTFTAGLWLIHTHGISGAAAATSLSLAVSMVLQGSLVFMRLNRLPNGDPVHA